MLNQVEDEEELWQELDSKLADGRTVYAPAPDGGKKRKRQTKPSGSRKNRLSIDNDSDSDDDSQYSMQSDSDSDLSGSDKENGNSGKKDQRVPLTAEQIDAKLDNLKSQKKNLRQNRKEADAKILSLRQEIKASQAEKERIESKIKSMCIQGRNAYSRTSPAASKSKYSDDYVFAVCLRADELLQPRPGGRYGNGRGQLRSGTRPARL